MHEGTHTQVCFVFTSWTITAHTIWWTTDHHPSDDICSSQLSCPSPSLPAESKRTQITEVLESIEERLGELEEEKEELREYQKWDKMHRSIEYTIHEKELRETRGKIDALTDQHDNASHKSRDLHKKVTEAQAKTEVCGVCVCVCVCVPHCPSYCVYRPWTVT